MVIIRVSKTVSVQFPNYAEQFYFSDLERFIPQIKREIAKGNPRGVIYPKHPIFDCHFPVAFYRRGTLAAETADSSHWYYRQVVPNGYKWRGVNPKSVSFPKESIEKIRDYFVQKWEKMNQFEKANLVSDADTTDYAFEHTKGQEYYGFYFGQLRLEDIDEVVFDRSGNLVVSLNDIRASTGTFDIKTGILCLVDGKTNVFNSNFMRNLETHFDFRDVRKTEEYENNMRRECKFNGFEY